MGRLAGKTAIVTGAARGIGYAIAERFVAEGARLLLCDIDCETLTRSATALSQPHIVVDVASKEAIDSIVATALNALGNVDIVVNNAGITHAASLLELKEDDFDRVLAINLKSALFMTQAIAPHMMTRRSGAVINMSSVNAILAIPNQIPYAVSKGALRQLTNVTALALAPYGIRVNAIGPGTIMTPLARSIITDKDAENRVLSRTPLGRYGEPSEIASIAVFLASEDASYLTGQTIYPDGGRLGLNYTMVPPQR